MKYKFNKKRKYKKFCAIYCGTSINPQFKRLRDSDIVVGTPGQVLDHISRNTIDLSGVKHVVLDEADRMLDMGFLPDVEKIIQNCPRERQTFLFSATISPYVLDMSKKYMKSPFEVSVKSHIEPDKLEQVFYDVKPHEKFSLLVHLLKQEPSKLVMVFANTKRDVKFLDKNLQEQGINSMALHGDLRQNKRKKILNHFHNNNTFVLVCTDVAARGLDINDVSHVYNYGSPKNSIDYVHRIGRTARAGKDGKAITIIADKDYDSFRKVNRDKKLNIKRQENPEIKILNVSKSFSKKRFSRGERRGGGSDGGRGKSYGGRSGGSRSRSYGKRRSSGSWKGGGGSRNRDKNKSSRSSGGNRKGKNNKSGRGYGGRGGGSRGRSGGSWKGGGSRGRSYGGRGRRNYGKSSF